MNKTMMAILATSTLASTTAYAEERSGFYLSGGIGISTNEFEESDDTFSTSVDNMGLATSFKIGGYLNPKFALYYQREANFWSPEEFDDIISGGLMGIGGTYYLQRERGMYFEGGIGIGDIFIADYMSETGFAFSVGGGYEVTEHIQIGAVFTHTSMEDSFYEGFDYSTSAFAGKIELKL